MTDCTLNEDEKKLLTKKGLDEKWHEWVDTDGFCSCGQYHHPLGKLPCDMNQSFTTFQVAGELAKKLVEKKLYVGLYWSAWICYVEDDLTGRSEEEFSFWLMTNPQRFAWLVVQSKVLEG